jgi:3-hydroxybutyryl-CoA dehydrogenase
MEKVAVIGAGTMGNGIAHVFAQSGYSVKLIDVSTEQLDKAIKTIGRNLQRQQDKGLITAQEAEAVIQKIRTESDLPTGVSDAELVVEAATENVTLKTAIFQQIDKHAPAGCILATNTSSISITKLAAATRRPDRVIGMHFMNPVPVMKLVEIIQGFATDPEVVRTIETLSRDLGKVPCTVKDYPGFIANRILMPMINEAIHSLFQGVAGISEIDTIMKLGMAHPMGPLQLADFIGLDVCLAILRVMQEGFGEPKYAPCPLLVNMVNAGKLGVKSGEGFYRYEPGKKESIPAF